MFSPRFPFPVPTAASSLQGSPSLLTAVYSLQGSLSHLRQLQFLSGVPFPAPTASFSLQGSFSPLSRLLVFSWVPYPAPKAACSLHGSLFPLPVYYLQGSLSHLRQLLFLSRFRSPLPQLLFLSKAPFSCSQSCFFLSLVPFLVSTNHNFIISSELFSHSGSFQSLILFLQQQKSSNLLSLIFSSMLLPTIGHF